MIIAICYHHEPCLEILSSWRTFRTLEVERPAFSLLSLLSFSFRLSFGWNTGVMVISSGLVVHLLKFKWNSSFKDETLFKHINFAED